MTDVDYSTGIGVEKQTEQAAPQAAPEAAAGLAQAIDPSLLAAKPPAETLARDRVFSIESLTASYGGAPAIRDVSFEIYQRMVTAIIGPSGCGKSTFIRCLNRMNDVIPNFRTEGRILYHDVDLMARNIDPVGVRRRIGMVFQRPNPFPKSIYENIAYGPRILGLKKDLDERVEKALRQAALWDEVKDRLKRSAWSLSGGQQQRLCIARCLAIEPDVILMDEPASALDPIATTRIEDLMHELKRDYTIVVVTHNMQQAARVADMTAFFNISKGGEGERSGVLVEYDDTKTIFTQPKDPRTEDYVTGRFG
jgi:phosphate transport system ATP-binding protein